MDKESIPLLDSIPIRKFEWEKDDESGIITVFRPKYISKLGQKYMLPFLSKKFFKIKLDELGTIVWENCDGAKTVLEIKRKVEGSFQNLEDIDERLKKFIMQLYRQKFIELVQKI